jgi:hypothetical protein
MAEVTGDFGGQPIQLNNAATEATLKQLLAAMTVMVNNTGKDKAAQAKSQKELEAELKKLAAAAKKQQAAQDKLTEAQKKAIDSANKQLEIDKKLKEADEARLKAQQKQLDQMNFVSDKLSQLGSTVAGLATGMTGMLSSLANLGDSLSSTAQVFGQLPVVGGVLGSMFGAVAGAAEKTYEAFKKSASVGANFGGSMTEMMDAATGAGLTFDQFSGILARTGKDLALLGGDSEAGARRLAALGKQIKGTALAGDLNRLGYSTEAINEGMASYAAQLAKTGSLQGMSNSQLIAQTGSYLKDLDALTKLTGQSKKELEDQRNARMKDAQFRLIASKLDAESQKNLHSLMDSIPAEHQEGMKEIIATGTATSEAGKKALAFLPQSARNMMQLNQQIRTTGKMGANQAAQINAAYQSEVKNFTKSGVAENMALYGDEASKRFFVGAADAAAREKNMGQIQAEQQKAAAERAAKEKDLQSKQLDPASMEEYKNKIAATSNEFTKFLANSGLLDIMMDSFQTLVDIVELVVVPAFEYVVDNFDNIVKYGGALIGAFLIYKGIVAAATGVQALQTLGIKFSLKPLAGLVGGAIGAAGALFKLIAPILILAAPFIAIGLAIAGTVLAVRALYNAGWDLGAIFEAIGDNFKSVMLVITEGFLYLLDKVTFGDQNKKIKAAQQQLGVERELLKEREKARDAQRASNRQARGVKEDESAAIEKSAAEAAAAMAASAKNTEAANQNTVAGRRAARLKQKETDAVKEAAAAKEKEVAAAKAAAAGPSGIPGVDLSNPQKMFDSMVRRQKGETAGATNQPGASAVGGGGASSAAIGTGLGAVAEKYESGGRGSGTVGWDKVGGTSYGKKQISSKAGAMTDFLKFLDKTGKGDIAKKLREAGIEKDTGSTSGKAVDAWKEVVASGALGDSENEWLGQGYKQALKGLSDQSLQSRINGSRALQEMLFSTAVQHGPGGAMKIFNGVFKPGMTDEQLVKAVYAERGADGGKKHFGGSTANVQAGVVNRFGKEQQDIMGLLKTGGAPTATGNTPGSSVPTTAAVQSAVASGEAEAQRNPQAAADAARAAAAANDPRRTDRPQTAVAGARQETPESLLASLNTKMDQLIAINQKLKDVGESQLSATRGLSNDMFSYGA